MLPLIITYSGPFVNRFSANTPELRRLLLHKPEPAEIEIAARQECKRHILLSAHAGKLEFPLAGCGVVRPEFAEDTLFAVVVLQHQMYAVERQRGGSAYHNL